MTTHHLAQLTVGRLRAAADSPVVADFVYRSDHTSFLRRRRQGFEKTDLPPVTMWWVPAGHVPTVAEALARMEHLKANGPSPDAFSFRQPYAPPGGDGTGRTWPADDRDACPA